MIYLWQFGFVTSRERDSIHGIFGVGRYFNTKCVGFRPWHLMFSLILVSRNRIMPLTTTVNVFLDRTDVKFNVSFDVGFEFRKIVYVCKHYFKFV